MPAFTESVTHLIRFGPSATEYGKPYRGTVAIAPRPELGADTCELVGLNMAPTREEAQAIYSECWRLGWDRVIVKRIKAGQVWTREKHRPAV